MTTSWDNLMHWFLQYFLVEPFTWLGDSILRPATFAGEKDIRGFRITAVARRASIMLRFMLPMFLLAYPGTLIIRVCLEWRLSQLLSPTCYLIVTGCVPQFSMATLLLAAASNASLGIIVGIVVGSICGAGSGVAIGLTLGLTLGIANGLVEGVVLATVLGLTEGIILGTADSRVALFIAWSLALGIVFSLTNNNVDKAVITGLAGTIGGGSAFSIEHAVAGNMKSSSWFRFIAGVIIGSIVGAIIWTSAGVLSWYTIGEINWFIDDGILSIYIIFVFIIFYIVGCYRIPLYPLSCISLYRVYHTSYRNTTTIFATLRDSALYRDEYLFLPLPYLRQILLLAVREGQYREQVLKTIDFIIAKHPRQIRIIREVALELVLQDLEQPKKLIEIAELPEQFVAYLPNEVRPDVPWDSILKHLQDARGEAARYCSPLLLSNLTRRRALGNMLNVLAKIYPETISQDATQMKRLTTVVESWKQVATWELHEVTRILETAGPIENPYTAGPVLELHNRLFVGRRDLVHKLEEALERKERRPTLFLYGERRMGKSSTLRQLPDLLARRYIPIMYDLQSPGFRSGIAVFLHTVAKEIYEAMKSRIGNPSFNIEALQIEQLQEASSSNEAATFWPFELWLNEVEAILKQEDRVLLLAFDEFEALEEAQRNGYFNVNLLLDWFRSVIQNHPRLALLFSGVHTVGEIQGGWTSYFVNTQTHKVSFLQRDEARQLMTPSIPDFPGNEIFAEEVIEEILRVTGCHPFLIQAICENIIDQLNHDRRNEAELRDVTLAMKNVLETWVSYFHNLWERTDREQRACLLTLSEVSEKDLETIVQHTMLDNRKVQRAIQILMKRDLVQYTVKMEKEMYSISIPIFHEWIKSNQ